MICPKCERGPMIRSRRCEWWCGRCGTPWTEASIAWAEHVAAIAERVDATFMRFADYVRRSL